MGTMKSESIASLAKALAKAQGEIENASKNANNPHFKSKYADLAEILNTVRPVFSTNGIAIVQFPSFIDGIASVETIITHESGEWMSGVCSAPVGKQDAQGVGSCITYLRRYSLAAASGIAQEDDDGNSAVGKAKTSTATQQANEIFDKAIHAISTAVDLDELLKHFNAAKGLASTQKELDAVAAAKDKRKKELQAQNNNAGDRV
jgi:hypothetical protein